MASKTCPHSFHTCRSLEQRIWNCPPPLALPVAKTYQVLPSFMIEGSCVPQKSPLRSKALGCCAGALIETAKIDKKKAASADLRRKFMGFASQGNRLLNHSENKRAPQI